MFSSSLIDILEHLLVPLHCCLRLYGHVADKVTGVTGLSMGEWCCSPRDLFLPLPLSALWSPMLPSHTPTTAGQNGAPEGCWQTENRKGARQRWGRLERRKGEHSQDLLGVELYGLFRMCLYGKLKHQLHCSL